MSETSDGTRSPFGERSLRPCSTGPKLITSRARNMPSVAVVWPSFECRLNVARRGAAPFGASAPRRRSPLRRTHRQAPGPAAAAGSPRGSGLPSDAGDRADTGNGMRTESGEQPTNVVVSMTIMVTRNTLRPARLPTRPKMMAPKGRTRNPARMAPKSAKVDVVPLEKGTERRGIDLPVPAEPETGARVRDPLRFAMLRGGTGECLCASDVGTYPPFGPGAQAIVTTLASPVAGGFHCRRLNPPSTRQRPRIDRSWRSHLEKQVELSYQGSDRTAQCKAKG